MACPINLLIKQAFRTFGGVKEMFPQNLEKLSHLLNRTSASDVGLKGHELLSSEIWNKPNKAPFTYVEIFEDELLSIGVFVLKPGMKLPLHDHPHMYGLIKVIAGTLKITSYSVLNFGNNGGIEAEMHNPVLVNDSDNCCILEPIKENLHEIESVGGCAAFLDILSPPYYTFIPNVGTRTCTYYAHDRSISTNKFLLKKIRTPSWYFSDTYPYCGPEIQEEELEDLREILSASNE